MTDTPQKLTISPQKTAAYGLENEMKNRKRLLALLLSLVLSLSLCACKPDEADSSEPPSPSQDYGAVSSPDPGVSPDPGAVPSIEADLTQDAVAFSAGLAPDHVLLTVNGEGVPADLFLYWLFWDCYYFEYNYYYYGVTVADFADMLLEDTVNMARYYTVLRQRAAELGCLPTDAQMREAMDELLAEGPGYYDSLKAAHGLSDESFDYITTVSYYYENLLDARVPAATGEMLNGFVYQTKHILLKTVDDQNQPLSDDEIAAQRALAEDLLARLQAVEGEERLALFDELMNRYSQDGRDGNGDLYAPDGYVAVLGAGATADDLRMVETYEKASLALPIGGMSGIVESTYGYHIILRGEVADTEPYARQCRSYHLDQELDALADAAEISRAAALDALDVAGFYERYIVYLNAVMEHYDAGDGGAE